MRQREKPLLFDFPCFFLSPKTQGLEEGQLRWAKSRESYRRIASARWSLGLISPAKTQDLVLIGPAFVALRFESRDWRSLV